MPLLKSSSYTPPFGLKNGHLQTIYANFRRVKSVAFRRERMITPDDDFVDLDWSETGNRRVAILSHGLEGNTSRPYVRGMVRALNRRGWDALAWNYRGCSGETNRQIRWYHSGETGDLKSVIAHVVGHNRHNEIALIGFSLGGNITLKYLGEGDADPKISKAVAISVPCDLKSSAFKLARIANRIYMIRFLRNLRQKIRDKSRLYPDVINDSGYEKIRTFIDFDNRYTAPIHGFQNAYDYFERCSSRQFLPRIRIPTLLLNAVDDPFLDTPSYPTNEADSSPSFFLETPSNGGHMGFVAHGGEFWSEKRALEFLEKF
jgi:uncharacterized protein